MNINIEGYNFEGPYSLATSDFNEVSGVYFIETNTSTFAEKLTADYKGFDNE